MLLSLFICFLFLLTGTLLVGWGIALVVFTVLYGGLVVWLSGFVWVWVAAAVVVWWCSGLVVHFVVLALFGSIGCALGLSFVWGFVLWVVDLGFWYLVVCQLCAIGGCLVVWMCFVFLFWVVCGCVCRWFACLCSLLLFVDCLWGYDMFDCVGGGIGW